MAPPKGHIPWNKGKKMSQKYIEANRQGHLGTILSEKTKHNMSVAHMGNKSNTGNKFTKENKIEEGTDVILKEYSNYEFNFDNERLYRVKNNQILATV